MVEKNGYKIIDCVGKTILEQAEIFSKAKVIVSEVGAVWANLIFCTPGTRVFSLCAESSAPTSLFGTFAQILGLDFKSIAFPDKWEFSPNSHWHNTSEAYFQSGFKADELQLTEAFKYIEDCINR